MLELNLSGADIGGWDGVGDSPIESPSTPATSNTGTFTPLWGEQGPDFSLPTSQEPNRPDGQAVPIAVTGMACRLPGECSTPSKLWETLVAGRHTWKPQAPADRFNWEAFHHPDLDFQGTFTVDGGHFNDYVDLKHFDAGLFSVPNAEAPILDPQQRLLLEVSYECLESAGVRKEDIAGKRVGCFVAFSMAEYSRLWEKDMEYMHSQHILGTGEAMYANRLSHVYDLAGPSMSLDTGCSGTLVALDVACKYLAAGAIDAAFVAGTHLNLSPDLLHGRPRLLSKTGRCHTFDIQADGFSRADGTSVLFLKRLDDAVQNRDPIRSVIRATATNFDGRTPGVFMPSMEAQMANIHQAYARAGIDDLGATSYFECHGTGTATGDPIEVEAIGRVFGPYLATAKGDGESESESEGPAGRLLIGSNKPNMGHSEAASALTSIIKGTFALESGVIPPTIGIEKMNPNIDFDRWPVEVVQELRPLPRKGGKPRISINAFGYGGANAHVILETAPGADHGDDGAGAAHVHSLRPAAAGNVQEADAKHAGRPYLLVHSANDAPSVQANVAALREHLVQHGGAIDRLDLAYTLGARRSQLHHRAFTIVPAHKPLAEVLAQAEATVMGKQEFDRGAPARIAFVFTGQGAQRPQMGKDLIEAFPSVQATLARLDGHLAQLPATMRPTWSIQEELLAPAASSRIHDPRFAQTLTCAMQIALTNLLRDWGVAPTAVVGHSSGEIPAVYAAGLVDEAMAIRLGCFRGSSLTAGGGLQLRPDDPILTACGMMAVGLGVAAVTPYLAPYAGDLTVACDNSPESVTVSGSEAGLAQLAAALAHAGVFHRVLKVPKAYHNPRYMAGYSALFKAALEGTNVFDAAYKLPPPSAAMFSSTEKGAVLTPRDVHNGEYWRRNMEGCVLFTDAVNAMLALPADQRPQLLLEIGPSSTLKGPLRQILAATRQSQPGAPAPHYLPTLIGGSDSAEDMLRAAGALFNLGAPVNLERVNAWEEAAKTRYGRPVVQRTSGCTLVDLPHYVFNHAKEYWTEPRASKNYRFKKHRRHELLGGLHPDASPDVPTWRNLLSLANTPWLPHHKLHDDIVFPAAGYLCMAAEAVRQRTGDQPDKPAVEMRHVHVRSALVMNDSGHGRYVWLTLTRHNSMSRWYDFSICSEPYDQPAPAHSAAPADPEVHCTGQVAVAGREAHEARPLFTDADVPADSAWAARRSGRPWYKHFARIGFAYTDSFQVLDEVRGVEGAHVISAHVCLPVHAPRSRYLLPPGVIDGAMQALLAAGAGGKPGALADLCVPTTFDRVYLAAPEGAANDGEPFLRCLARIDDADPENGVGSANVVGHSELRDAHGNVVLAFQRLACTRIEAGGASSATDRTQVHKVQWRPDFALLAASSWADNADPHAPPQVRLPSDAPSPLSAVVDLLGHAYPAGRWAAVCRDAADVDVVEATAQQLAATPDRPRRFAHFNVLAQNQAVVEMVEERIRVLIPDKALASVALLPESPDEAAIKDIVQTSFDYVVAVNMAGGLPWESLMAPDGRLLLACTPDGGLPATLDGELKKAGFSGVDMEIRSDGVQHSIVASTKTSPEAPTEPKYQPKADDLTRLIGLATSQPRDTSTPFSVELDNGVVVLATLQDPHLLTNMSEELMARLRPLAASKKPVVWLTREGQMLSQQPEGAMVQGLARVLSQETPELVLITVDTDSRTPAAKLAHLVGTILDRQARASHDGPAASDEREFAVRDGVAYTNRVVPAADLFGRMHQTAAGDDAEAKLSLAAMEAAGDRHWKFDIDQPGLLQTLAYLEMTAAELEAPLGPNEMELHMRAAGVNFKDVAISQGLVPQKPLGLDVAGVVLRVGPGVPFRPGDRVAGPVEGAYRSRVRAYGSVCFRIPDDMSFEDAASLPIVWYTNIIAMMRRGHVRPGESVLIHSAAGGVGLSAILLARHLGAEVYATVGSADKRALVVDTMDVAADRVFDSRSASFQTDVLRATGGRGVDFVVDSMTGDLLDESWNCLADNGTLLSLGKVDFHKRHKLQMRNFTRARNFCAVDTEIYMKNERNAQEIVHIMNDLLAKKVVKAVQPLQVHNVDELPSVLRHIQSGRSVGKMVIRRSLSEGKDVAVRPAINPLVFPSDASYLLIGCFGGIGRSITSWMFEHGARHFIMLSPSGGSRRQAQALCNKLRQDGATIALVKGSAAIVEDVERAIASAPPGKPIKGMLHAAMVLNDAAFPSLTAAQFRQTTAAKVDGARNLHEASLRHGHELDFFVILSSVSGLFGQHGQAAYAAANSYLDSLAAHRVTSGLPAMALDLGFVDDIGWAMENEDLDVKLEQLGMLTVRVTETEVLRLLEVSMQRSVEARRNPASARDGAAASLLAFDTEACQIACGLTSAGQKPWSYFATPRFRALLNTDAGAGGDSGAGAANNASPSSAAEAALLAELQDKESKSQEGVLASLVVQALCAKLAEYLLLNVEDLDVQRSPEVLGIDSLVAVSLRTWLRDRFGATVATMEILKASSLNALGGLVAGRL